VALLDLGWRAAPADIDENHFMLAEPLVGAHNVAAAKARVVAAAAGEVIVAADTLVVADGDLLGKPGTVAAAHHMLRQLRGRSHQVLTGVALRTADENAWGGVVSTRVVMRDYTDQDIDEYVGHGEPFDKAGGYAIQDAVFRPVDRIDGCYLNVVGLPLCAVVAGLAALGFNVEAPTDMRPPCGYCRAGAELVAVRSGY
jgi:MAF protein